MKKSPGVRTTPLQRSLLVRQRSWALKVGQVIQAVTFLSSDWKPLNPLKGDVFHHPKKVKADLNHQVEKGTFQTESLSLANSQAISNVGM